MKISFYKFVTTFCLIPTTDLAAILQRWLAWAQRLFLIAAFVKLVKMLSTPFWFAAIVAVLTYFPDSVAWVFIKLGEIELRAFAVLLSAVMPDIFANGAGEYQSWAQIWQTGLNALPAEMLEIMNGLGVSALLGMVTATISSVWIIKIYRKIMLRGGLL